MKDVASRVERERAVCRTAKALGLRLRAHGDGRRLCAVNNCDWSTPISLWLPLKQMKAWLNGYAAARGEQRDRPNA